MTRMISQPTLVTSSVILEDDAVQILDRRVFPFEFRMVTCKTVEEVAIAIEQMVTQSSGPWFAAAGGMALAAREAERAGGTAAQQRDQMESAAQRLISTRRTNNHIREVVTDLMSTVDRTLANGDSLAIEVRAAAEEAFARYRERSRLLGEHAATLIPDGATILTHCWAETYLTYTVSAALEMGKSLEAICTETRPYLQGARLTAESLAEMGVRTRLITDGMPASLMARGDIDLFITAADRVTMDGHVINKVGTFQIALAAHALNVPYVALVQAPDQLANTATDVEMEDRDGDEVLHTLGVRTASSAVTGIYPAFDITPPRLVSVVATDRGRFSPFDLSSYYSKEDHHG